MAEQGRADRAGDKADGVNAKGLQYPDQWVGFREIQFREDQRGHKNVEQEIVRLDDSPEVLATTARRSCRLCSASESWLLRFRLTSSDFLHRFCCSGALVPAYTPSYSREMSLFV